MHILLPTLVACCHDNKSNITVLEQEASPTMLIDFIEVGGELLWIDVPVYIQREIFKL